MNGTNALYERKCVMQIGMIIRWLLSLVLAVIVWMNAHWSVALSLTFVFITIELRGFLSYQSVKSIEGE